MELEIFERFALSNTTFGPLVYIDKGRVGGSPRTPLLDKSLEVEASLSIGKLPGAITDRLKGNDISVVDSRHADWRKGG